MLVQLLKAFFQYCNRQKMIKLSYGTESVAITENKIQRSFQ